ncbi:MAG: MCE family protein [Armatimonadetes bacterium]|nr:MCE family protein [Armatimonadota bacterium]MDE2205868.1 MCE family protein [Armatimonadota bacterium]
MAAKPALRTALVGLVALVVGVSLYLYLAHLNPNSYLVHVSFADTQGVEAQSPVRMDGVQIGEVRSVELDTRLRPPMPVVTLSIRDRYQIPADSRFEIAAGLLISNPQLHVVPGVSTASLPQDGSARVTGAPPTATAQELVGKANRQFDAISGEFKTAAKRINTILASAQTMMQTANKAASSTASLLDDQGMRNSLLQTVSNFRDVSAQAKVTSQQLSRQLIAVVKTGNGSVTKITGRLSDILAQLDNTIEDANSVVKKLTEQVTDPRLVQSLQDTAELARATLSRFNQIASDLDQLVGDPALQSNLKSTVSNLSGVTRSGEQTLTKVNTLLDRLMSVHKPTIKLPPTSLIANVAQQFNPGHLRLDLDAQVHVGKSDLVDIGLYDLGQTTRWNLQYGKGVSPTTTFRFGVHASQPGVGLDWAPSFGNGIQADLYDTRHPKLDLRGLLRVNRYSSIWLGSYDLLDHPAPAIGLRIVR